MVRVRGAEAEGREVQVREGRRRQEGRGEVVASLEVEDLGFSLENKGGRMGGSSRYPQSTATNMSTCCLRSSSMTWDQN